VSACSSLIPSVTTAREQIRDLPSIPPPKVIDFPAGFPGVPVGSAACATNKTREFPDNL
jgi:hypothetical protein